MDHEQTAQIISLAASAGQDTDRDAIVAELARMATADELEAIAAGGCDMETRQTLFAAAAMARQR